MYKYIRTSTENNNNNILEYRCGIFIDFCYNATDSGRVAASVAPGEADSHRLKFEAFVVRVLNMMRHHKYEIISDYTHDSNNDDSESMYFAFKCDKNIRGIMARFIVFIRISEHPLTESSNKLESRDAYYAIQHGIYGLEQGDWLFHPIKIDPDDPDSRRTAIRELSSEVKEFTDESITNVISTIESGQSKST